jgi:hypothetical protein
MAHGLCTIVQSVLGTGVSSATKAPCSDGDLVSSSGDQKSSVVQIAREVCRLTRRFFDAVLKDAVLKHDAEACAALKSAAYSGESSCGLRILAHKAAE